MSREPQYLELILRHGMTLVPVSCSLLCAPCCLLPRGVQVQGVLKALRTSEMKLFVVDASALTQRLAFDFVL